MTSMLARHGQIRLLRLVPNFTFCENIIIGAIRGDQLKVLKCIKKHCAPSLAILGDQIVIKHTLSYASIKTIMWIHKNFCPITFLNLDFNIEILIREKRVEVIEWAFNQKIISKQFIFAAFVKMQNLALMRKYETPLEIDYVNHFQIKSIFIGNNLQLFLFLQQHGLFYNDSYVDCITSPEIMKRSGIPPSYKLLEQSVNVGNMPMQRWCSTHLDKN